MNALEFEDVTFAYPGAMPALVNVAFVVKRGTWVAVAGRNGSGKSTMARLTNGLLLPSSGRVIVGGSLCTTQPDEGHAVRKKLGLLFQNPDHHFVATTLEEDIAFGLENDAMPQHAMQRKIEKALSDVGLSEARRRDPRHLSGGQKQRAALAGLIAREPDIYVMDESFSMIDPVGRQDLLNVVRQLLTPEKTLLTVTHSLEEMLQADRLLWLEEGRLTMDGNPADVILSILQQSPASEWPSFVYEVSKQLVEEEWLKSPLVKEEELVEHIWRLYSNR
ncbi:ATP-binding cassette domain-containing protein [Aureibacillus halotolerans]|uniref:Energy-coupling factor transport system ATP-binding protein n=1 Tax=Aureibacillus halotolerans TaxID=1508390 RepID=A0A4R6TUJ1_9BACI|nr:ATP-binding cassette domain-containing protein [Aureibacillus halotolerans]TDQ34738.1 energy-coupling factor transport system ATP-binding protein [Aureibacillus halotolerans]